MAVLGVNAQNNNLLKAPTPPLGWNSYNSYGAAVTEEEIKANADYMAENMKDLGWEYVVVDYCWFYPHPPGSIQANPPQFRLPEDGAPVPWIPMDEYSRLLPDPRKFPSSENGKGFKPLADYVHSKGLKFGIHVMRGIPRQAQWAKSSIKDAPEVNAAQLADTTSVSPWLNTMYGVDMTKKGAQEYYNSLVELYESWGVDYIKIDDIDLNDNYPYRKEEVEAMRKALDHHKSDIVLSLSLNMKFENREHVKENAELWRISKDFWDEWDSLKEQFELIDKWNSISGPDSWPDADMLQIGKISKRGPKGPERFSNFTEDEMLTHISLWSISKSPLMMGGNMPENTPFVKKLLTTPEVIRMNQYGTEQKQLWRKENKAAWMSTDPDSGEKYIALFNLSDSPSTIRVDAKELGFSKITDAQDIWKDKKYKTSSKLVSGLVNPHGVLLLKVEGK
ncbi:glycoside hydrolase family 27 protein [Leeuwenhoekiella parthenopeia]|uniref:Alpha-galactosidase n=1 Tax=Leeuwenhoekiella parthenopeia TaxID=2890320 RepID=A0ABS8GMQ3_9FLAO|nr:glycoside hydrolase family 27 protein [Leeuwenhoekiella parthenopeia]MCC4211262.1 glycoside hydrolase family 27 protein [Leeuwenhoekiella parthenopeia]